MPDGWTASVVARALAVPVPTVTHWIRMELAAVEKAGRGRGGHLIGRQGLLELLTVQELREVGMSLGTIRAAVFALRELRPESPAQLVLLVVGNEPSWTARAHLAPLATFAANEPQRVLLFPVGLNYEQALQRLERAPDAEAR